MLRLAFCLAIVAVLLSGGSAWADGRRDLDDGIAFYNALDTERAQQRLRAASRAWDLQPPLRAKAFIYLGMLAFELGRSAEAKRAWQAALTLDADRAPPPTSSPKILRAFERTRRTLPNPPPPLPPQDPPPADESGPANTSEVPAPDLGNAAPPPPAPPPLLPPPAPDSEPSAAQLIGQSNRGDDDEGTSPWLWVGIGGAALAVAATVLVVVLATSGDDGSDCAEGAGGCVFVQLR